MLVIVIVASHYNSTTCNLLTRLCLLLSDVPPGFHSIDYNTFYILHSITADIYIYVDNISNHITDLVEVLTAQYRGVGLDEH